MTNWSWNIQGLRQVKEKCQMQENYLFISEFTMSLMKANDSLVKGLLVALGRALASGLCSLLRRSHYIGLGCEYTHTHTSTHTHTHTRTHRSDSSESSHQSPTSHWLATMIAFAFLLLKKVVQVISTHVYGHLRANVTWVQQKWHRDRRPGLEL